ncbi:MAG: ABC transporter permease [Proteobacteria bacterium]|nr:ABC transporter permease [Pseudomonadota bacterium]
MPEGSPDRPRAWQRLWRRAGARTALLVLGILVALAVLGPWFSPWQPQALDWSQLAQPPQLGHGHWLGTDRLGRDLYVRTLYGLRLSLALSLIASGVSLLIGIAWGSIAGFAGGRIDGWMMRVVDVLYALPYLFIVIILTSLVARGSLWVLLVGLGGVGWLTTARIVRAQTLALRGREFIVAARATGLAGGQIITRHIVPNLMGTVLAYAALTIPQMILFESFLSFLGLGVQEPHASLGNLVYGGAQEMESAPWMLLGPAAVLVALLLCLNRLGDGLRDALDPREY